MLKTNAELKELFQVKFDTEYEGFTGYPGSAAEFKSFLKSCLDAWIVGFECTSPVTVNPKPVPIVSASASAFVGPLILAIGGAIVFPTEMKNGFIAMINSTSLPPSGDYTGTGTTPIIAIDPLIPSPGDQAVYDVVYAMCYQYNTGEEFCANLANVIGNSMAVSGVTNCAHSNPGAPPSYPMPLIYS